MPKIVFVERDDAPPIKNMKCDCGHVTCLNEQRGDFSCICHREYNAFGQELAPRNEWEENDDYDPAPGEWV